MNRCLTPLLLSCVTHAVVAADIGVGIPLGSNDQAVYLPMQIYDAWRIEPLVSYKRETQKFDDIEFKRDELAIGTGVFHRVTESKATACYAGARAGYVLERSDENQTASTSKGRNNGYFVAPTFGCEYRIGSHFTFAGEVDLRYDERSGDIPFREEVSTVATGSRLIVRFTP